MHSRSPTVKEKEYYELDSDVPIFLPTLDDEENEPELLPDLVKSHVKKLSVFIKSAISGLCD